MKLAAALKMDIEASSRIFNYTDEILRTTPAHPSYAGKFMQLNERLMHEILEQPLNSYLTRGKGGHLIVGMGATVCSFSCLSVYHFIRMVTNDVTDIVEQQAAAKKAADLFYSTHKFYSGGLPTAEEEMRFFAFYPRGVNSYRVEHLMQVLPNNRHDVQVCHMEITKITEEIANG